MYANTTLCALLESQMAAYQMNKLLKLLFNNAFYYMVMTIKHNAAAQFSKALNILKYFTFVIIVMLLHSSGNV